MRGAGGVIAAGGIPVAFHWVLALFLLVLARRDSPGRVGLAVQLECRHNINPVGRQRTQSLIQREDSNAGKTARPSHLYSAFLAAILFFLGSIYCCSINCMAHAQVAPSHDLSRVVRNVDGRYWIFTTATASGRWHRAMPTSPTGASSRRCFRSARGPAGSTTMKKDSTASSGRRMSSPSTVSVSSLLFVRGAGARRRRSDWQRTQSLAGPWTDQSWSLPATTPIDPAPLVDGSNQWLTWGNWQTGVDLLQLGIRRTARR